MTLPYCITPPSNFLYSASFCFFSNSAACCDVKKIIVKGRKKFLKNIHANLCLLILHKNNFQVEISIVSRENSCKSLSEILSC